MKHKRTEIDGSVLSKVQKSFSIKTKTPTITNKASDNTTNKDIGYTDNNIRQSERHSAFDQKNVINTNTEKRRTFNLQNQTPDIANLIQEKKESLNSQANIPGLNNESNGFNPMKSGLNNFGNKREGSIILPTKQKTQNIQIRTSTKPISRAPQGRLSDGNSQIDKSLKDREKVMKIKELLARKKYLQDRLSVCDVESQRRNERLRVLEEVCLFYNLKNTRKLNIEMNRLLFIQKKLLMKKRKKNQ